MLIISGDIKQLLSDYSEYVMKHCVTVLSLKYYENCMFCQTKRVK